MFFRSNKGDNIVKKARAIRNRNLAKAKQREGSLSHANPALD